jgi:hypothetical protein
MISKYGRNNLTLLLKYSARNEAMRGSVDGSSLSSQANCDGSTDLQHSRNLSWVFAKLIKCTRLSSSILPMAVSFVGASFFTSSNVFQSNTLVARTIAGPSSGLSPGNMSRPKVRTGSAETMLRQALIPLKETLEQ